MTTSPHGLGTPGSKTRGSTLGILAVHGVVGLLVLVGLFRTVLAHRVDTASFDRQWVQNNVFQDRWTDLSDHWIEDGYIKNAGLWYLNIDRPFRGWTKQPDMYNSGWISAKNFDPEAQYYYRSNPASAIVPLAIMQRAKIALLGGKSSRRVTVLHNQLTTMFAGCLLGMIGTILARRSGLSILHALALGVCAQIIFQTHPINIASFFRLYFQHSMNIPICLFILSLLLDDGNKGWRWIRAASVFLFTLADPSTALIVIAGYLVINLLVDLGTTSKDDSPASPSLFRSQRCLSTILAPCAAGILAIFVQFGFASMTIENFTAVGSKAVFRTGLDGNTRWHDHLYMAFQPMIFENYLYGPGKSNIGGSPVFWLSGFAAIAGTVLAAAWSRPRGEDQGAVRSMAYCTAILSCPFLLMSVMFNNAMVIHAFIYPLMILPAMCLAMFAFVPSLVANSARWHWPIVVLSTGIAFAVTMSNLRYFAVTFPIDLATGT